MSQHGTLSCCPALLPRFKGGAGGDVDSANAHQIQRPLAPTSCLADRVEAVAMELLVRADRDLPDDYRAALEQWMVREEQPTNRYVLETLLSRSHMATVMGCCNLCAKANLPRFYLKIGNDAPINGGFVPLERALQRVIVKDSQRREPSSEAIHPLWRSPVNGTAGIIPPKIEYSFEPDVDWIDLIVVKRGGLFGNDYRVISPGDGLASIRRFLTEVIDDMSRQGMACQPAVIGIGIGGGKDTCMAIGKQAACLRVVGNRHPDPEIAALEEEFCQLANGTTSAGQGGRGRIIDCHIEVAYAHSSAVPVSIHSFCLSSRRAVARLYADGRVSFRTDPLWFTNDYRRDVGLYSRER